MKLVRSVFVVLLLVVPTLTRAELMMALSRVDLPAPLPPTTATV